MNRKGFTLIELIATIIIIGVLAAILSYVARQQITKAKKNAFREDIRSIIRAAEIYKEENNSKSFNISISKLELKGLKNLTGRVILDNGVLTIHDISNGNYCGNGLSDDFDIVEGSCIETAYDGAAKAYIMLYIEDDEVLPTSYNGFDLAHGSNIMIYFANSDGVLLEMGLGFATSDLNEEHVYAFKERLKNYYMELSPDSSEIDLHSYILPNNNLSYVVSYQCEYIKLDPNASAEAKAMCNNYNIDAVIEQEKQDGRTLESMGIIEIELN